MIGIYKITSPSGKIYIGQSWDIEKRWKDYTPGRCLHQRKLNSSLKKYGSKLHTFEIVYLLPDDITQEILDNYEIFYYNQFKDVGYNMLNLKDCGKGGGKHSEETKRIIGLTSKGRYKTKEGFKIYQYDLNLNLINIWNTAYEASGNNRNKVPGILRACKSIKPSIRFDYFWLYESNREKLDSINLNKIKKYKNQYGEYYKYK